MNSEKKIKLKKLSILFVDDEELVIEAMKDILPMLFKESFFATNGIEALKLYKAHNIDIVITDLSMPKMGGLEMITKIKEIKTNQKTICVSGHNEVEFISQSQSLCNSYIVKPISTKSLFQALEDIL